MLNMANKIDGSVDGYSTKSFFVRGDPKEGHLVEIKSNRNDHWIKVIVKAVIYGLRIFERVDK